MKACRGCGTRPPKTVWAWFCYHCRPGRSGAPPCRRCGSTGDYYSGGLCTRCHPLAPQVVDSCLDCYAWGAVRTNKWLCQGCRGWRRKYPDIAGCIRCVRVVTVDREMVCRLCRKQPPPGRPGGPVPLASGGHQLFLADMFRTRGRAAARARVGGEKPPRPPAPADRGPTRRPRRDESGQLALDMPAPPTRPVRPRPCPRCGQGPVKDNRSDTCHDCTPGGPTSPPPCRRCGSARDYYSSGLCTRCHLFAPQVVDTCLDCFAWGARRRHAWRCQGCRIWRQNHPAGLCISCDRPLPVARHGACRLCYKQAARQRGRSGTLDIRGANRWGQQLFLADMGKYAKWPAPLPVPPPATSRRGSYPVGHRQLLLLDPPRDLVAGRRAGFPEPPDPYLAGWLDGRVLDHARAHGWSPSLTDRARRGTRTLLALQDSPGARIRASHAAELHRIDLPATAVIDILQVAGMLEEDRASTLQAWFDRQVADLPPAMADELRIWFQILAHGSRSTPRTRPRQRKTIQIKLRWAQPALRSWAAQGHTSLREITRDHVEAALAPSGTARATRGAGLRSIFRTLKAHKVIFTDPTARIRVGRPDTRLPMPTNLAPVRQALDSSDPATAAMASLAAFHALTPSQLRTLRLTDLRDGRLHLGGRTVLLAEPVRQRLSRYLDHRYRRWPATQNPHLFITQRSAVRTVPVNVDWIGHRLRGLAQAMREDRILDEAIATGGDVRRLCDLFGLSIEGAQRYTATLDHPDLAADAQHRLPPQPGP